MLLSFSLAFIFTVASVFCLKDDTWLEYLDCMPCPGRDLTSIPAVSRGEADAAGFIAVVIINDFVKPSPEAYHAFI